MEKEPDSGPHEWVVTFELLRESLEIYRVTREALRLALEEASWGSQVARHLADKLEGISFAGLVLRFSRGDSCSEKEI